MKYRLRRGTELQLRKLRRWGGFGEAAAAAAAGITL
jgi:hypothetical protein